MILNFYFFKREVIYHNTMDLDNCHLYSSPLALQVLTPGFLQSFIPHGARHRWY